MGTFDFATYEKNEAAREARANAQNKGFAKVGFFKLKNKGDSAIVRINLSSNKDFMFATYHQLGANVKYMKVACLDSDCPLCRAAKEDAAISKVKTRVFIPMLVSYKQLNGEYTTPEAVIWDAPAAGRNDYAARLADKISDFGDLRERVFKITRNGEGLETTYSIDYIPTLDNENILSKDFSAFDNFRIDKHSFWVKTAEEMNEFLQTGAFPAIATKESTSTVTSTPAPVVPTPVVEEKPSSLPWQVNPPTTEPTSLESKVDAFLAAEEAKPAFKGSEDRPARSSFGGFSF